MKQGTINVILLFFLTCTYRPQAQAIIGYYPAWTRYTCSAAAIEYGRLTHIAHAFIWPRADGSLDTYSDFYYPELIAKDHISRNKLSLIK